MRYEYVTLTLETWPSGHINYGEYENSNLKYMQQQVERRFGSDVVTRIIAKRLINESGDIVRYVNKIWLFKNNKWFATRKTKKYFTFIEMLAQPKELLII